MLFTSVAGPPPVLICSVGFSSCMFVNTVWIQEGYVVDHLQTPTERRPQRLFCTPVRADFTSNFSMPIKVFLELIDAQGLLNRKQQGHLNDEVPVAVEADDHVQQEHLR